MSPAMNILLIIRLILVALAIFGALAAFNISQAQWTGSASCPSITIVPACYVVLAGYSLMVISAIFPRKVLFLMGWIPVFLLAAIGTISEFFATVPICPRTAGGIPQCYLSLALVLLIGITAFYFFKKNLGNS
jgi:hypothetical protein